MKSTSGWIVFVSLVMDRRNLWFVIFMGAINLLVQLEIDIGMTDGA
jgi:hypothetical protein